MRLTITSNANNGDIIQSYPWIAIIPPCNYSFFAGAEENSQ